MNQNIDAVCKISLVQFTFIDNVTLYRSSQGIEVLLQI